MKKIRNQTCYAGSNGRKTTSFANARFSFNGGRTEKHTILTWTVKLQKLKEADSGADASAILVERNEVATPDNAFVGSKRVGVLNLLQQCGDQTLELVTKHHSKMDKREFVFTDDREKFLSTLIPNTNTFYFFTLLNTLNTKGPELN